MLETCTATVTATPQLLEVIETRERLESEPLERWGFFQPGVRRPYVVPAQLPSMFFVLSMTSGQR
jgi:hypothetical protein